MYHLMTNGAGWSKLHPFSLSPSQCVLPSHSNKTTPLPARHWSSYQISYQTSLWNVHIEVDPLGHAIYIVTYFIWLHRIMYMVMMSYHVVHEISFMH